MKLSSSAIFVLKVNKHCKKIPSGETFCLMVRISLNSFSVYFGHLLYIVSVSRFRFRSESASCIVTEAYGGEYQRY